MAGDAPDRRRALPFFRLSSRGAIAGEDSRRRCWRNTRTSTRTLRCAYGCRSITSSTRTSKLRCTQRRHVPGGWSFLLVASLVPDQGSPEEGHQGTVSTRGSRDLGRAVHFPKLRTAASGELTRPSAGAPEGQWPVKVQSNCWFDVQVHWAMAPTSAEAPPLAPWVVEAAVGSDGRQWCLWSPWRWRLQDALRDARRLVAR